MLSKLFNLPWPPGFFWLDCPCCGVECSECDGPAARTWEITVAGVTNGTCSNCGDYNGTFQLNHNPLGGCSWFTVFNSSGCTVFGVSNWLLGIDSSNAVLNAQGDFTTAVEYRLATSSFDCLGSNVMTLISSGSECNNWPSTITIAPAA